MISVIDPYAEARALRKKMAASLMPPHPEWNSIVPRPPTWFRVGIKRIDKQLILQYLPPNIRPEWKNGCNAQMFPYGVWVVMRQLRGSKLLHAKWVYGLYDEFGGYKEPDGKTLEMIRIAHRMWVRRGGDYLDKYMDAAVEAAKRAETAAARDKSFDRIVQSMRRHNLRSSFKPRMTVPAMPVN